MRIELLTSPGCPNAEPTRTILTECLAALGLEVPVIHTVGPYPSPTLLIDGRDIMHPESEPVTGESCRLDLPTPQHVREALRAAHPDLDQELPSTKGPDAGNTPLPLSIPNAIEHLSAPVRGLHRAVLRGFLDAGAVHRDQLSAAAAALGVDLIATLGQLAAADLVHTGRDGRIEIAYPFSDRPTGTVVHLVGHPPVAAMCAIDALGIPLMSGSDGVITSIDPTTSAPIRVERAGRGWTWHPATIVVSCCGTLAATACPAITFHTERDHADAHLAAHREPQGTILDQGAAIE
ncbi:organomercurial lyase, partial [Nocardia abscessus]|uniref:organomercurial lyase n=1 Tax=Nocardia abscessus TaxID=120957 RepID=UPI00313C4657